jgi:hypothetical protein
MINFGGGRVARLQTIGLGILGIGVGLSLFTIIAQFEIIHWLRSEVEAAEQFFGYTPWLIFHDAQEFTQLGMAVLAEVLVIVGLVVLLIVAYSPRKS